MIFGHFGIDFSYQRTINYKSCDRFLIDSLWANQSAQNDVLLAIISFDHQQSHGGGGGWLLKDRRRLRPSSSHL